MKTYGLFERFVDRAGDLQEKMVEHFIAMLFESGVHGPGQGGTF